MKKFGKNSNNANPHQKLGYFPPKVVLCNILSFIEIEMLANNSVCKHQANLNLDSTQEVVYF